MDLTTVFDFAIPTLHPLAVHLPLVAIPAAAVAGMGFAAVGGVRWLYAALGTSVVGAAGALFATRTGEALHHSTEGDPMVDLLVEAHEWSAEWALYTVVMAVVVLGTLAWQVRRRGAGSESPRALRVIAAVLLLLASGFVLYAGHVGATMVWGVPVG